VSSADDLVSIGTLAARSGLATSAIRFYQAEGLIRAHRNAAGHRRFSRSTLRRLAFIRAGQRLGIPLAEIRSVLALLPEARTPTPADWALVARSWRRRLDRRIGDLQTLRDQLTSCMGCGCLSLQTCGLYELAEANTTHPA
jgi:MerR family redox-sensitive transcriptional activator SoxR